MHAAFVDREYNTRAGRRRRRRCYGREMKTNCQLKLDLFLLSGFFLSLLPSPRRIERAPCATHSPSLHRRANVPRARLFQRR